MLNEENIKGIIEEHKKEIQEIKSELKKTDSKTVKYCLEQRLSYLNDSCYRYKLLTRACKTDKMTTF